jgi:hypothetical protein
MNGISTKEEEIDKKMTQVLFAGFPQKISYKSRRVLQYPPSFNRLVHSFTIFCIRKRTRKNIKASIPFSTCYMKSGICCSHSEAYIMLTLSKKEEQQRQQQAKNGYWQNELYSLGIEPKEKKEFNDKEENENLSDNIKQAMFQDYKLAYSEKGDAHTEEANSTVTVG